VVIFTAETGSGSALRATKAFAPWNNIRFGDVMVGLNPPVQGLITEK
jgi:hypothetical protein